MIKSFILGFPFPRFGKNKSCEVVPKLAFTMAMLRPLSVIAPKVLTDDLYKGAIAFATCPFGVGDKIKIDKYDGVVKDMSFWYLVLERPKGYVYIPTSHVYSTAIELFK
ncbi:hypothetical protein CWI42_040480 [Ordospora colligata]|uniref:Mechanosensitive ion channel MscS domain-containing protein n=1 Tax=Ordospora colligata OC4 TaxID=1354746 RepID=A0A0B2ULK2_9MICR|nr:uncharacterized protein M896_040480 [Ordospora colligata OC4]KHN69855.1 hypothetical protein M896_040480 [Ordospora colligata OC4]TBU16025.1 hypothetical protein CWI41_040480 [Ordospora colligata]TBU16238.1 hypothetical protein CWI40_040480 [Ordospora colligata]TBU18942.1 hypothetical protein CWI42_040480 [Ordospora colligata]